MIDYLKDPAEIYRRSLATVRAECDLARFPAALEPVAVRLVHACGMPAILADLAWAGDVAGAARAALGAGRPVLVDATMVGAGIIRARLPADNPVICRLDAPGLADRAAAAGTTRSAAAVDCWDDDLDGAVVAIGNAPTALFRLLQRLLSGAPRPAAILAFPVGFIGAAESKAALIAAQGLDVPYLTLQGLFGGSALAAAAVNALAGAEPS